MIIKAAVARQPRAALAIETLDLDEPRADEVLVRLIASGVDPADLHALETGRPFAFPFVPGRSGAGIVERTGRAVDDIAPGDAVILGPAFCRHCSACLAGHPEDCRDRVALNTRGRRGDGSAPFSAGGEAVGGFFHGCSSFATHALCHDSCAVKVGTGAPLELLACLGGDVFVAASAMQHALSVKPGDTVVITGAGAAGLAAAMAARNGGAAIIIVADPDEGRRTLAAELGATLTVHTDDDLAAVVMSLTGDGARIALETTGHELALAACLESLAPGGLCGLTRAVDAMPPIPSADIVSAKDRQRVDLARGSGSPHASIRTMVAWHRAGLFPIEKLVGFFPFERINDALRALDSGAVAKPIIRFSIGPFDDLDRADVDGAVADTSEDQPEPAIDDLAPAHRPSATDDLVS